MTKYWFQADDFGHEKKINLAIIDLYNKGKIKSISVLVDFLVKEDDFRLIKFLENKKLALHVNLTEGKRYHRLPFFVAWLFLGLIRKELIEKEIQRQIDKLRSFKVNIIELNSHQHLHVLSPISEILVELAKRNKINSIRSYKGVKAQTPGAKITLYFLKIMALLSSIIYRRRFSLPESWEREEETIYYMSWEGKNFKMEKSVKDKPVRLVIHPGSSFDKNTDFLKFL